LKKSFPFYKSIRTKAVALFFGVFLVILIPTNWLIFQKIVSALDAADTSELNAEAGKLVSGVKLDPITIPLPPNGYLLKIQVTREIQAEDVFTSPEFPILFPDSYFSESLVWDTLKIVNQKKTLDYSANTLIVSLARSTSHLTQQVATIRSYLIGANVISLALAGILVFIAAGKLINPIKKIILVASHITASKSIARVEVPQTQDESQLLAETLNDMFRRMEWSIKNQINFFASAAHELRTPLAVMQTEIGVALQQADATQQKILQSQLHEVERLNRIIQDFLLISQLKSETLIVRKKEERIEEVIYAALKKVKYLVLEKKSKFQIKLEGHLGEINCSLDFDKIETVLSNLLENALKHSATYSIIQLSATTENETIIISIHNPIEKSIENIHLLKNEFQKSSELSGGLGMGLWICNQIVKLHAGKLELISTHNEFIAKLSLKN
jgi:signal transduction histidine kinase